MTAGAPASPIEALVVLPPTAGGGLERSTALLLHGFDPMVVRPTLVLTHARATNPRLLPQLPADVEVVELDKRGFLDQRRVVRRLRELYEDVRPGAVIGRATYANVIALLARRGARHRPAMIVTEHVTPELSRQPRNLWLRVAARRLYPGAEAVVGVGRGVAHAVQEAFGVPEDRLHVIENSFDIETDAILAADGPSGAPFGGDRPVVLYVGRLSPEKGVDDLLRALPAVLRERPVRLLVIGEGPERDRLELLANELGVAADVEWAGYVMKPFRQMAAADVFVMPSHFEAFSVVLLEAMRSSAAIVVADCDWGPREVIDNERNGLLVPVRDPAALAAAILRVLGDADLAASLRRAARESSERYTPRRNIDAYQDLVLSLTSLGGGELPDTIGR